MTRRDFLRRPSRRPQSPLAPEELAALSMSEEERMIGWLSLRRQLLIALRDSDSVRLARYVALSCRKEWELERLFGRALADEQPQLTVVSVEQLGPGTALYTVRERAPSTLAEQLFGEPRALEADLQVTAGREWLLRALRPTD
jgi:hypothetical protein